jgi:hypothetical protein
MPNASGNDFGSPPQIMPATACRKISSPSVTMTAFSGGASSTGRMTKRSTTAPSTSPATSATANAAQYEWVPCTTEYATNVVIIIIPPWAKLTIRVERQIRTRASAAAAYTTPALMPVSVRLTKRSIRTPGRRAGGTRRRRARRRGASTTTRPTLRTTARSAIDSALRAFCSTSRTVRFSLSRRPRMTAMISAVSRGARPSDGSSSSSTRGRLISARPIASICRSPPDSVCAGRRRRSASGLNSV